MRNPNQFSQVGLDRKVIWILIVIFLPIIGAISYYFLVITKERMPQDRESGRRFAIWTGATLALLIVCIVSSILCMMLARQRMEKFHELAFGGEDKTEEPVVDKSQTKEGDYREIVITAMNDGTVVLNQKVYKIDELSSVLTEEASSYQKIKVIIKAVDDVPHGLIVDVLNACAQANIWNISFATYKEKPGIEKKNLELEVKHDFKDIQDKLNQLQTLFKAGEISIEEFVSRQDELIESNPDFKKEVESALTRFEAEWQAEAQAEFNDAIRSAGLKVLTSARDRDVIAELWQLKRKKNRLEAVWLLKTTSSRQITGGGSGSSLINQLVLDKNIVDAEGMGGGNRWHINDKPIRLPKPYGRVTHRTFQILNILEGKVTLIITERIRFNGQSKNEGEIFSFKFPNVFIPDQE